MNPRAVKTAARIAEKTVARTVGKIAARTARTTVAARATPITIDRTTNRAPGTDSVATSKIATHDL
jgi:hypothetical protein